MPAKKRSCPLTHRDVVDRYFLEHRAKLLDIAAFLDRLDRSADAGTADPDFRVEALRRALRLVSDGHGDYAKRTLEFFSDPSTEPIAKAPMQGAHGAHDPKAGR